MKKYVYQEQRAKGTIFCVGMSPNSISTYGYGFKSSVAYNRTTLVNISHYVGTKAIVKQAMHDTFAHATGTRQYKQCKAQ